MVLILKLVAVVVLLAQGADRVGFHEQVGRCNPAQALWNCGADIAVFSVSHKQPFISPKPFVLGDIALVKRGDDEQRANLAFAPSVRKAPLDFTMGVVGPESKGLGVAGKEHFAAFDLEFVELLERIPKPFVIYLRNIFQFESETEIFGRHLPLIGRNNVGFKSKRPALAFQHFGYDLYAYPWPLSLCRDLIGFSGCAERLFGLAQGDDNQNNARSRNGRRKNADQIAPPSEFRSFFSRESGSPLSAKIGAIMVFGLIAVAGFYIGIRRIVEARRWGAPLFLPLFWALLGSPGGAAPANASPAIAAKMPR